MLHACVEVDHRRGLKVSLERAVPDRLHQRAVQPVHVVECRDPPAVLSAREVDMQCQVRGDLEQARPRVRAPLPLQQLGDVAAQQRYPAHGLGHRDVGVAQSRRRSAELDQHARVVQQSRVVALLHLVDELADQRLGGVQVGGAADAGRRDLVDGVQADLGIPALLGEPGHQRQPAREVSAGRTRRDGVPEAVPQVKQVAEVDRLPAGCLPVGAQLDVPGRQLRVVLGLVSPGR